MNLYEYTQMNESIIGRGDKKSLSIRCQLINIEEMIGL